MQNVGAKKAVDIFCGGNCSFYVNDKSQTFAWGQNNHGQLGIGHRDTTYIPSYVSRLADKEIKNIVGGEHHTVCLTKDG